jgi:phosphate transport system substrate-binding protein
MLKKNLLLLAGCIVSFSIALPDSCPASEIIRINGSGSALDMLKPLAEAYRKTNREARFVIEKPLGSSGAVKALLADALDIVVSSKQLKPDDSAKGAQLKEYGRTPLVLVTENNAGKKDITTKELEDIYEAKTTEWKSGEKIRLVLRPKEDIDTSILKGLSRNMNDAVTAAQSRPGIFVAITDPEAYAAIAKTPGGFGATGLTSIITQKLPLTTLSLNGVKPTPKNLASGAYPLYKEISFVTTAKTPAAALKFIGFVYSPQGQAIAEKTGVFVTAGAKAGK